MLNVQSISKSYGKKQILDTLSFSIQSGEIVGLVGENGAGKSTLLQILATLINPTKGIVQLNDLAYEKDKKEIRKQIGFVPQDIAIWEEFTVEENMVFFEKLSWENKSKQQLKQLCLDMELDKWKEPVYTMSGGMKRKLNLAISLIHNPHVLLLDEPTVGIDLKSRKEIGNYLKDLATNQNKIIIYTSHDMDEIINLCDQILCIGDDPFYNNILEAAGKHVVTF
ncbi:ABC transporter ATP-binding protein [Oceanobacillus sp. CF4.6]|uniref:ABC transporter ATP-binding protein n=1 Tax=Oceanobacillus sp. CF4.6 TaxID=3373080 RepID=UPI003EE5943C